MNNSPNTPGLQPLANVDNPHRERDPLLSPLQNMDKPWCEDVWPIIVSGDVSHCDVVITCGDFW